MVLLSFLQQHQDSHPNLQMVCPWGGVPLPSIDITLEPTLGLSVKIELSLRLCEALIQYGLALTVTGESSALKDCRTACKSHQTLRQG